MNGRLVARTGVLLTGVLSGLALLVIFGGSATGAANVNKTYGITTAPTKKGTVDVAVKRPGKLVFVGSGRYAKATGVSRFKGWGGDPVVAGAKKIKLCTAVATGPNKFKLSDCTQKKGTLEFDMLAKRKCKLKKGGRKKSVRLYGRTTFQQQGGPGVGIQFGTQFDKPKCPKF